MKIDHNSIYEILDCIVSDKGDVIHFNVVRNVEKDGDCTCWITGKKYRLANSLSLKRIENERTAI